MQYEDRWKIWSKAKYDMMTDREKVEWLKCENKMDEKWKCEFGLRKWEFYPSWNTDQGDYNDINNWKRRNMIIRPERQWTIFVWKESRWKFTGSF